MTVCEGVTVHVLPNWSHKYLMTTKEVANGYGTSTYAIRQALLRNRIELIEGIHFIVGHDILSWPNYKALRGPIQNNSILLTKRGIVRLGFFIKSERARLFRDWAEELIIRMDELAEYVPVAPAKALPRKRNHNRLTSERLIRLLQLTHRIEDAALRNEMVEQLMGGR